MKKIVATTKKEDMGKITPLLEEKIYFSREEAALVRITIYVRDEDLDELIERLEKCIDLRYKKTMIEVYTPDFVVSPVLAREKEKKERKKKTPVEELIDSTRPHLELDISKIALTSVAGIIALTGLFMDSVAIIIGSMLLAPLLGPIYAFAINTAVGKVKNAVKGVVNIGVLVSMVVIFSFFSTVAISLFIDLSLTQEIQARMDASPIYMIMAILLGFASVFAISRNIPESIAGIAIAAALLPPAVVTGISFSLYPSQVVHPLLLTVETILGLMAGSLFATFLLGIEPRYRKAAARRSILRTSLILISLLLLLYLSYQLL